MFCCSYKHIIYFSNHFCYLLFTISMIYLQSNQFNFPFFTYNILYLISLKFDYIVFVERETIFHALNTFELCHFLFKRRFLQKTFIFYRLFFLFLSIYSHNNFGDIVGIYLNIQYFFCNHFAF